MNIFIVEDSPIIAASLKHIIVKLGHKVAGISESYEDAVFKLNHIKADVVITDIMLVGKKDGIDLGAYIKKHLNIPVIYQSSIADTAVIGSAMRTNPIAYLIKPVKKLELLNVLLNIGHQ